MGEPEVIVARDLDDLAARAAERVVDGLAAAIAGRGRADIALSGGSTPVALYRRLAVAPWRDRLPWEQVRLWFGDERYVPIDHPDSNMFLAQQTLLGRSSYSSETREAARGAGGPGEPVVGIPVPAVNVHAFAIGEALAEGHDAAWVAERYAADLADELPAGEGGDPAFDVVLVGMGPDGHILSCFPGSPALADDAPVCLAVPAPTHIAPHHPRLTLAPRVLRAATTVLVLVSGSGKATIVRDALGGDVTPEQLPASVLRRDGVTWMLDEAAAALLPG